MNTQDTAGQDVRRIDMLLRDDIVLHHPDHLDDPDRAGQWRIRRTKRSAGGHEIDYTMPDGSTGVFVIADGTVEVPVRPAHLVRRDDKIAGLRAVAELLEANPDIPWPLCVDGFTIYGDSIADKLAGILGRPDKTEAKPSSDYIDFMWTLHGLTLKGSAKAEEVCARIVTGSVQVGTETHEVVSWVVRADLQPKEAAA